LECTADIWPDNEEYLRVFNERASRLRIPLSGSLDLTYRCNLRCVHCYLAGDRISPGQKEMGTRKILSAIDEIAEAGCLFLLLTGGEPLLRDDFPEIYSHAKRKGLLITIFTNGTLITKRILELFRDLPPHIIEISLYGATASTYEKITGISGSFKKCMLGIRRLYDHKLHVRIKTILMSLNSHEFFSIQNIAKEFGIKFRFDAALFPCKNGDKTPLALRVPAGDAVEKEFSDADRARSWKKYFERVRDKSLADTLYTCGAGITGFHIDPYGFLKPCLMTKNIACNLSKKSFLTGWRDIISMIGEKKAGGDVSKCHQCKKIHLCGFCPAFFEWENGQEDIPSEYLCAIGNHRFKFINKSHLQGVQDAA
jgi:radical SAM protein with 4Fe4S-binding SPASM domain